MSRLLPTTLLVLAANAALAQDYTETAFTSMGPFDQRSEGWSMVVSKGATNFGDESVAAQFESATRGKLAQVVFSAFNMQGPGGLTVALYADEGDKVGSPLEVWDTQVESATLDLHTLTGSGDLELVPGTRYWLGLTAQKGSALGWGMSDDFWNNSPWQKKGLIYGEGSMDFTTTNVLPAFRIETSPAPQTVPEPSALAVLGLATLALRRRKRAQGPA